MIIKTVTISGIDVIEIEVQIHVANGQPGLTIVGLGNKTILESKERIRAVLSAIGIKFPPSRITINLAPADLIKEGTHFDLPIALSILSVLNVINSSFLKNYIILGELSLNGDIRPVSGVLPASIYASIHNYGIICPYANKDEAAWGNDSENIIAAKNILSLINHIKGTSKIESVSQDNLSIDEEFDVDISDVIGQNNAKRALLIAAAGGHNLLMIGSPGIGKSMLANRISTILPPLNSEEMLETSMIRSVSGIIKDGVLSNKRPFRKPHHSISMAALLGGGKNVKPGEVTLAHNGVLFLDELPEYSRYILDSIRQVMEDRDITISRADNKIKYPANFQLIAAMNPCHCGYAGVKNKECGKVPECVINYQKKISGPILDRIDLQINMISESNNIADVYQTANKSEFNSKNFRKIVTRVRELQTERYKEYKHKLNSSLNDNAIKKFCFPLSDNSAKILSSLTEKNFSMRTISRILKVARTISDIKNEESIHESSLLEAVKYKIKDNT